jgi:hypothetical protein
VKHIKYKLGLLFTSLVISTSIVSCSWTNSTETKDSSEIEKWKLGWRLISSSWDKNFQLGEQQFDSLLKMNGVIETKFLVTGLDILSDLDKKEKIISVLSKQDQRTLEEICSKELFTTKLTDIQICKSIVKDENATNKALQIEIIKMYINDQSVRGNVLSEVISKYKLDDYQLTKLDAVSIDKMNRDRLKEIILEFGFPTRKLVGKEAMQGIFLMIQHSDGDKEWQREQLTNIEKAVKLGDMDGQSYAYLYDRIKINGGEKQLYGTQFKNVDPTNKKVELADTEDVENLDRRRMEVGMMPIQMYKQFMLNNLPK